MRFRADQSAVRAAADAAQTREMFVSSRTMSLNALSAAILPNSGIVAPGIGRVDELLALAQSDADFRNCQTAVRCLSTFKVSTSIESRHDRPQRTARR